MKIVDIFSLISILLCKTSLFWFDTFSKATKDRKSHAECCRVECENSQRRTLCFVFHTLFAINFNRPKNINNNNQKTFSFRSLCFNENSHYFSLNEKKKTAEYWKSLFCFRCVLVWVWFSVSSIVGVYLFPFSNAWTGRCSTARAHMVSRATNTWITAPPFHSKLGYSTEIAAFTQQQFSTNSLCH